MVLCVYNELYTICLYIFAKLWLNKVRDFMQMIDWNIKVSVSSVWGIILIIGVELELQRWLKCHRLQV